MAESLKLVAAYVTKTWTLTKGCSLRVSAQGHTDSKKGTMDLGLVHATAYTSQWKSSPSAKKQFVAKLSVAHISGENRQYILDPEKYVVTDRETHPTIKDAYKLAHSALVPETDTKRYGKWMGTVVCC